MTSPVMKPEDITDEMVERAAWVSRTCVRNTVLTCKRACESCRDDARRALEAALCPPSEPEIVVTDEMKRAASRAWQSLSDPDDRKYLPHSNSYAEIYRAMRKLEPPAPNDSAKETVKTVSDSVAVGFPINRNDGLISLHVGGTVIYLNGQERHYLIELLINAKSPNIGGDK